MSTLTSQLPTQKEQSLAKTALRSFNEILTPKRLKSRKSISLEIDRKIVSIPYSAFEFLNQILAAMSEGKVINLIPLDTEISTQRAADILNVSRPFVVKLLDEGVIPHKKIGKHRRIKFEDLDAYRESLMRRRRKNLAKMTEDAQKMGLGY